MENKKLKEIPELSRMSSKGQVVIPLNLRRKLHVREGSVFAISNFNDDVLILKKMENPLTREDLKMAKEVENAWKEIERGEFKRYKLDEFLKKLNKT